MIGRICAVALAAATGLLLGMAAGNAAEKNPLIGKWTVTGATVAPWADTASAPALQVQGKKNVGLVLLFTNRTILTKDRSLRCRNPSYELTKFPADHLFQSALPAPDQAKIAAAMGLGSGLVAGVDVNCSAGLFSYHLKPDGQALFAYDNVIYTLARR